MFGSVFVICLMSERYVRLHGEKKRHVVYFTVTDLARFLGVSGLWSLSKAM